MKKLLFFAFLMLTLIGKALAAPVDTITNTTTFTGTTNIDAYHFINAATFEPQFDSFEPFDFLDLLTITNRSIMYVQTGFLFDNEVSDQFGNVSNAPLSLFGNGNQGQIYGGTPGAIPSDTFNFVSAAGPSGTFPPQLIISATNIVNSGLLDVDVTGIISITGQTVNLSRGTVNVEGWGSPTSGNHLLSAIASTAVGITVVASGTGTESNALKIANFTPPNISSPNIKLSSVNGGQLTFSIQPIGAAAFALEQSINASNTAHQIVFINTNLPGISTSVGFQASKGDFAIPTVQWQAIVTNITGQVITNFLYLQDIYGSNPSNTLVTNSYTLSGVPILAPYNYSFTRTFVGFSNLMAAESNYVLTNFFASAFGETNVFSALEVNVQPTATSPDTTALTSSITNIPGRIEITAQGNNSTLDLTQTKIGGANYVSLSATNQFLGSAGAQIVTANMGLNLGSTNGTLSVSNLVTPTIPRFNGLIDLYSARWTNYDATSGMTNTYYVLIVDSSLQPFSPVVVQDLLLRSTNVVLSDLLNVSSNLLINAQNLTISSNLPSAATPSGTLLLANPNISIPNSLPTLVNFTNYGTFEATPSVNFQDLSGAAYGNFVNYGSILVGGVSIFATNFVNSGPFALIGSAELGFLDIVGNNVFIGGGTAGPFTVNASNALFNGGQINSPSSDITIAAGNLTVSNTFFSAYGNLTLIVTNSLVDGGASSGNFWTAGDSINLLQKPAIGDFLGTTAELTAPAGLEVSVNWAGQDLGRSSTGFRNNGAMGHLVLSSGDNNSAFAFGGLDSTTNYAIYVDQIDLQGLATNLSIVGTATNLTAFDIAPNMKVYYADAMINGVDVSEKLNNANNGQLVWVSSFAGVFSGTNVMDSSGHSILVNRPLANSPDIDSNGNGIVNSMDTVPFFTATDLHLKFAFTNLPPKVPVITWTTTPNSTNILYFLSSFASTNQVVVTNFVATNGNTNFNPTTKLARVVDKGRTNSTGFYKVQVNPAQP